ncbi:unnamed protein product [Paramecium sonneborni]|uniref:Uncharacterized protein n=1 Tax=Paramecium sonneborni TaxID=65129 RepID=A0A8S1Q8E9_9CILI|nr:unnamed protein product [Paramecium sonneborni]
MKCDFCEESTPIIDIMRHSLFLKYSQSQNYHYTKGISEILYNYRTPNNILYKDVLLYDTPEELLCKAYHQTILFEKLQMLGEYYKFHNDIPRLFMVPAIIPLNYYHDKKRRLEYFRIAKLIANENKNNPDKPPKGIVGDSPLPQSSQQMTAQEASSSDEPISKCEKILDGISFIETKPQFVNFKQQLQQYQLLQQTIPNFKYEKYKPQIKHQAIQPQKPNNSQQRKSSITNILNMLKNKVPKTVIKKKNQSMKSDQLHITPRDIEIKSPTNRTLLPNQQRIATLLKSPKCVTPRAPQQSPHLPKKVQQLEIKVMTDLQTLLAKKHTRDSKQFSTVHFDNMSLFQDPRSLTQRFESTNHSKGQFAKKKLNIKELNQFRRAKIQEPLSNRDPPRKLNFKSKSNDKPLNINISNTDHKINFYQPVQSARQVINSQQQITTTFKQFNAQSLSQQIHHQKSATAKTLGKSMKSTQTLDSQICKVALNLAVKNIRSRKS